MRKENKYAIFNYKKIDEDLIDILSSYIEEKAHIAFDFFQVSPPKTKVKIKIISSKIEYDNYYIKMYNLQPETKLYGWMIGNFNFEKNQITYLSLHDFKNTTHKLKDVPYEQAVDYYKKTILHEFVHYVNGLFRKKHNCGYAENFLTEGIATYLSGQNENSTPNFDFSLDEVLDRNKNIYGAYFLLTKYFIENYDRDFVLNIFQSSRQSRELLKNELFKRTENYYKNKI